MSAFDPVFRWFRRSRGAAEATGSDPPRVIRCSIEDATSTPVLHPTLGGFVAARPSARFIPAAFLAQKAKSVSDGIVAALEELATAGDGKHPGVLPWLRGVHDGLPAGAASDRVRAALEIGETGTTQLGAAAAFLANPVRSKPLGFYGWNDSLGRAFRRDRFLQEPLAEAEARELTSRLSSDAALADAYRRHLRRVGRLTNELSVKVVSLESRLDGRVPTKAEAILPPSQAPDAAYGSMTEFFRAVREGKCDLAPTPNSGFYAHQLRALVALLAPDTMPESRARTIDKAYAEVLERLAGVSLFFGRETHVKQLELLTTASPFRETPIYPTLTIEPVPSFYRLTAAAFRFLREVVAEGWGEDALGSAQWRASGPIAATVGEGIDEVTRLGDAAAALSERELAGPATDPESGATRTLLDRLRTDDDVTSDARGMVPTGTLPESGGVRALVFTGWEERVLEVRLTRLADAPKKATFGTASYTIPVPVVRALDLNATALMDRDELRRALDSASASAKA